MKETLIIIYTELGDDYYKENSCIKNAHGAIATVDASYHHKSLKKNDYY